MKTDKAEKTIRFTHQEVFSLTSDQLSLILVLSHKNNSYGLI